MTITTTNDARGLLSGKSIDDHVSELTRQLEMIEGAYSTPLKSGLQIALSKLFGYLLLRESPVCLYLTDWSIGTEHFDLFEGYRRSLGETRPLIEAPVHVFQKGDEDTFISFLCLVFFFSWDAWVFDIPSTYVVRMSHDEWIEVRTSDRTLRENVVNEFKSYRIGLLAQ
jgi:hypothetical protein